MNAYLIKILNVVFGGFTAFVAVCGIQRDSNKIGFPFRIPAMARALEAYYTCPMHPTIVQEQPGTCPICGMDLVPKKPIGMQGKKSDRQGAHPPHTEDRAEPRSFAGIIRVDPVMVQNMGIRVAEVKRGTISRRIRTIGEIEVAEDQLSVVNLRFSGWIEKIFADQTGMEVKRGQPLFLVYSPELVSAQKEYLLAYNTSGKDSQLTKAAAERILFWDIPNSILAKIVREQNVDRNLIIRAPSSGYILQKSVVEGGRVQAGLDLYRIGNLKKIWVNAEIYEFDAPWIRLRQPASMELSFQRGRAFKGSVNYIYPTLNKKSRTLKVRLEFLNPGIQLKPGMFATVRIESQRKEAVLVIPSEAIIHSGERQLVFVTREIGKYEPREIVTGLVGDDHETEVLSGLRDGEMVVTSGQFLLDSESQLQEAVQKLLEARLQAKETTSETLKAEQEHRHDQEKEPKASYWTCSMHPQIVQDGPGTCPVCGMDLVEKKR